LLPQSLRVTPISQITHERSGEVGIRTKESLLAALIEFFKDNPAWE
jgi:hypothetical protein